MWHKYYKYVGQFLDVIRSKTPKIILAIGNAKCYFMLDESSFEIDYATGERLIHSIGTNFVKVFTKNGDE